MTWCIHCERRKAGKRTRGLCPTCHRDREVRESYPKRRSVPPVRCAHCKVHSACRVRGLCAVCNLYPAIRARFPTPKEMGDGSRETPYRGQPTEPTPHLPHSPEKFAVMAERAAKGQDLHHPLDGRLT